MDANFYLTSMFKLLGCISLTALCSSFTAIVVFYSYKMAENFIMRRTEYLKKVKKSKVYKELNKETIRVIPEKQRRAESKIKLGGL